MSTVNNSDEEARATTPKSVFHEGETRVQERAGVRAEASRLGLRMMQPYIDRQRARFLRAQPFLIVASSTPSGQVWASMLSGKPGFAAATAPDHVIVRAGIADDDPLAAALEDGPASVGLLVIEPATRSRIRVNGIARRTSEGLELDLTEVFGNCPKYIQRRVPSALGTGAASTHRKLGARLDEEQVGFIGRADTFFIASRHPERGCDASHRGGRPGFVQAGDDGVALTFPDYQGNNMFQTLGNLTINPQAGLLFIDWGSGRTVQIAGHADVIWDPARVATWPGAERLVELRVAAVIDRAQGSALRWSLVEPHRLNPPLPVHAR